MAGVRHRNTKVRFAYIREGKAKMQHVVYLMSETLEIDTGKLQVFL